MFQHKCGQTISEYGLIMGLALLVGLAALFNLSATVQNGFANMLRGHSASSPIPGNAGQMAATPAVNAQASMEMPIVQGSQITTTGSSVQVSGANGGKIYANSQKLFEIAAAYQANNPTLYNLLIQLGNSGLTLGGKLGDIEAGKTTVLESNFSLDYDDYSSLAAKLKTSKAFKLLSPADQALVLSLTQNTTKMTIDALNGLGGEPATPASTVVKQNSTTTKGCGEKGHC